MGIGRLARRSSKKRLRACSTSRATRLQTLPPVVSLLHSLNYLRVAAVLTAHLFTSLSRNAPADILSERKAGIHASQFFIMRCFEHKASPEARLQNPATSQTNEPAPHTIGAEPARKLCGLFSPRRCYSSVVSRPAPPVTSNTGCDCPAAHVANGNVLGPFGPNTAPELLRTSTYSTLLRALLFKHLEQLTRHREPTPEAE